MSIGVIFSNRMGRYEIFSEARNHELIERLRRADLVVGYWLRLLPITDKN